MFVGCIFWQGDYHSFMNEIEKSVRVDLSVVHDYLDSFALQIIQFLRERLDEELWNRICILDDASTVLSMDEMNRLSKRSLHSSDYVSSSQSPTLERKGEFVLYYIYTYIYINIYI